MSVIYKTVELSALPESGEKYVIYIVGTSLYIWDGTQFVQIGGSSFDPTEEIDIYSEQDIYIESDTGISLDCETLAINADYININSYQWKKALGLAGNSLTLTLDDIYTFHILTYNDVDYMDIFIPCFWLGTNSGTVNCSMTFTAMEYQTINGLFNATASASLEQVKVDNRGTTIRILKPSGISMNQVYGICRLSATITKSS